MTRFFALCAVSVACISISKTSRSEGIVAGCAIVAMLALVLALCVLKGER